MGGGVWERSCLSTEPARRQAAAAHSLPSGEAPGSAVRPAMGKGSQALTYIFLALPAEIAPANKTEQDPRGFELREVRTGWVRLRLITREGWMDGQEPLLKRGCF